jgi:GrpB-like predicted nucleotidyltransferase (UPF0157 family)
VDFDARKTNAWQLPPPSEPASDEYLASVSIGKREPLNDRIRLAPYDANWPSMFTMASEKVRRALAEKALRVEHVGSTAVPSLSAKPVIDMIVVVDDSSDEGSYVPLLDAEGFTLRAREPDWFQHRLLVLKAGEQTWQLHVFSIGCEEVERMVAFRDWLRTHENDRRLYESTKVELAARTWKHVQNYADAKSEIIRRILEHALRGAA